MLRNRSRRVTKQPIMATDHQTSLPSPTRTRPVSPFFGSPRFFTGFLAKGLSDNETAMSPTSILDTKKLSNFGNPFGLDKILSKPTNTFQETKPLAEKFDQEAIGLALIEEKVEPNSRKVLVGSKLKIQIHCLPPSAISPLGSPKSPGDFGTKTRNSQFCTTPTAFGTVNSFNQTRDSSPRISTGPLSLSEMELSEEYTCVISRGSVPKTTHIYDNCVVESCCGVVVGCTELKKELDLKSPSQNFLSFCHTCKKSLGEGSDIYMYRGEKAFCSEECRCQEMVLDGLKHS